MAGRIPEDIIDEISARTNVVDLVGNYIDLKPKGGKWWGLCPFHTEKTPSFTVDPEKNLFYCFGCHKGGSVFQFVMEQEGLNYPEAIRYLAEKAGVVIPGSHDTSSGNTDSRKALAELYTRAAGTFRWLLLKHPQARHARDYLAQRGISEETAQAFQIGWAPPDGEWLYRFLKEKGYSDKFLAASGLFSKKSPRWSLFVDRLMFPIMPEIRKGNERTIAFSGRALTDRGPKYINSPENAIYQKRRELYGYGQAKESIRKSKCVVLCEGNLDVLSCFQAGVTNTAAPLGTAFTPDQARLIKRLADTVTFVFDGDEAGRAATFKAAVIAEEAALNIKAVTMPPNSDPSEILLKKGAENLKKMLKSPITIFEYLLESIVPAGGEDALAYMAPYLDAVDSEVRKESYLRSLADSIGADAAAVIRDYRHFAGGGSAFRKPRGQNQGSQDKAVLGGDELFLLTAVAVNTEYYGMLRNLIPPEMLKDERALAVYRVLDELAADGNAFRTDAVLARIDDDPLRLFIVEKASTDIYRDNVQDIVKDIADRLIHKSHERELKELISALAQDADPALQQARLVRVEQLNKEIMGQL